jgi:hypothetical protein
VWPANAIKSSLQLLACSSSDVAAATATAAAAAAAAIAIGHTDELFQAYNATESVKSHGFDVPGLCGRQTAAPVLCEVSCLQ